MTGTPSRRDFLETAIKTAAILSVPNANILGYTEPSDTLEDNLSDEEQSALVQKAISKPLDNLVLDYNLSVSPWYAASWGTGRINFSEGFQEAYIDLTAALVFEEKIRVIHSAKNTLNSLIPESYIEEAHGKSDYYHKLGKLWVKVDEKGIPLLDKSGQIAFKTTLNDPLTRLYQFLRQPEEMVNTFFSGKIFSGKEKAIKNELKRFYVGNAECIEINSDFTEFDLGINKVHVLAAKNKDIFLPYYFILNGTIDMGLFDKSYTAQGRIV